MGGSLQSAYAEQVGRYLRRLILLHQTQARNTTGELPLRCTRASKFAFSPSDCRIQPGLRDFRGEKRKIALHSATLTGSVMHEGGCGACWNRDDFKGNFGHLCGTLTTQPLEAVF